uniref:Endonuclease-reverse transcriptase n=1 Tax=Haemonchus contortus TaxID=6289 RepID=A0A7I4XUM5_HAECO
MKFRKRSPKTSIDWDHFATLVIKWENSIIDNIDEEYNRLVEHLRDSATRVESLKKRLSSKTLELIRQRGIARATGNYQQTSELAKLCREAINSQLAVPEALPFKMDMGVIGGQFHNEIDHIIFSRRKRSPKTSIDWDHFATLVIKWENSIIDNIDEEYNRLVEHLRDSATRVESLKKRLSSKTLELIRQRGIARATGNYQQTSELAKLCREAIKEDLKERRAAVMDEAAEARKSIRKDRRSFANYKTKMTSLRRPDGTATASRRAMEKVIYDFYSDLFDSHVYLPTHHLRQDEYIAPSVLPSEIRHAIP